MRSTKIVATVGPASRSPEMLAALLDAGVNVFRINASHGAHGEHGTAIRLIRTLAAQKSKKPAILMDLQGPKIRLGDFDGGAATLKTGDSFTLTIQPTMGNASLASATYASLPRDVVPGNRVLLADGAVELRAAKVNGASVEFEVVSGGTIKNRQGINLPGVRVSLPSMTEKDCADLEFGLSQGIDLVALSFVRGPADVIGLRHFLEQRGKMVPIVAKIEKPEALDHLDDILHLADGVMVARGDLGVELALQRVPVAQKTIIEHARMRGKFVITATQMLESMIENASPTRAEVNDVANAIFDGTDAVMLSAETASGKHPVQAVRMMASIAVEAEAYLAKRPFPEPPLSSQPAHSEIITEAAYHCALSASVRAIVVFTSSGETARLIARFRPRVPIFAFCESEEVARKLAVIFGVHTVAPIRVKSTEQMLEMSDQQLLLEGWSSIGDSVIAVAGAPFGVAGSANLIKLHKVGRVGIQGSLE
ncbi:MAG: pyruvate kinase [Bryobacteraceae bacterium]